MKRLRRFFGLSPINQLRLIKAALLVGSIRIGLCLLPFWIVHRLLTWAARIPIGLRNVNGDKLERDVAIIEFISQYLVCNKPCLTQALAVQLLYRRAGYSARLRIGVMKEAEKFQAHAWVESQGQIVVGGTDSPLLYKPLPSFESEII
jgi:hypothetical protein